MWGGGLCHQTENLVNNLGTPASLIIENGRHLNLLPTRFLSWNTWPWHPIERTVTISHVGATLEAPAHADEASLTSQTKPIESIWCQMPTHPKMYVRAYSEGIKVWDLLHRGSSDSFCHARAVTLPGEESSFLSVVCAAAWARLMFMGHASTRAMLKWIACTAT